MSKTVKNIPLSELLAYLLETPEGPTHVGAVQVFEPVKGDCSKVVERVIKDFRESEVGPPFNYIPVFPKYGRPKWAEYEDIDPKYHVRHISLVKPGTNRQLLDMVSELHEGMMDRSRPGWMAYIIEGLEGNRFALYTKIHHAYIDGSAMVMRMGASMSDNPKTIKARPLWAPLPKSMTKLSESGSTSQSPPTKEIIKEIGGLIGKTLMQAGGFREWEAPLPFSAPKSVYNSKIQPARSLGAGSIDLPELLAIAKAQTVSVNELVLTLVGAALERHSAHHGVNFEKPLVASCPLALRREGDAAEGNQIASLSVKLGEPNSDIVERLIQVHQSSVDAKTDAKSVGREALMNYQLLVGGLGALLGQTPLADRVPPSNNVNVSNVAGPPQSYYLSGSKMVQTFPVSVLAMGTAINITFGSMDNRMDFAIISDAHKIPDAQRIADLIAEEFKRLKDKTKPRKKTASKKSPAKKAPPKKAGKRKAPVRKKNAVKNSKSRK